MKTYTIFSSPNLRTAVLVVFLLIPIVGCSDSTVSPCVDCSPATEDGMFADVTEKHFAVGEAAIVAVDNFTGKVTYRTGEAGAVRVIATRRSATRSGLEHIEVSIVSHEGGLDITSRNPLNLKRVRVDLEIIAPASAAPHVKTGVGDIDYTGRPKGDCVFGTGVGSVRLRLPADVNATVELRAGVGSISTAFAVDPSSPIEPGVLCGKIGHGGDGHLYASTAVGNISLIHR